MTITTRALAAALLSIAAAATLASADEVASGDASTIGDIRVEDAWTRQAPPGARAGGGYATITNAGTEADRLIGGWAPFSERFEVHEMSVTDGVMRMREIDGGLEIPPGETVELRPGGLHLMFIDMTEPPVAGGTVPVTLLFERAGEVTLELPVAAIGALSPGGPAVEGGMDHGSMSHGGAGHGAMDGTAPSPDGAAITN